MEVTDDPTRVEEDTSIYVAGLGDIARPRSRGPGLVTSLLAAALVAAVAFTVGVRVEKGKVTTTAASNPFAALAAGRQTGAPTGTGARGGAAGAAGGGPTFGQVKLVDGTTIYVTDASGNIVKVTTTPESKVTKTVAGSVADLRAGDTVIVQGVPGPDGTVAATSVSDSGAGGAAASGGFRARNGGASAGAAGG
jgi:hypothetical protein